MIAPKDRLGDPKAFVLDAHLTQGTDPCSIPIPDPANDPEGKCNHSVDPLTVLDPTPDTCARDPKNYDLTGYSFFASDASQLGTAVKKIFSNIRENSYTFTTTTVPAVRMVERDVLYMPMMSPRNNDPWRGNIKAYQLNANGTLNVNQDKTPDDAYKLWDAGEALQTTTADSRKIYTSLNGSSTLTAFTYEYISNTDLSLTGGQADTTREKLIKHIRGIDAFNIFKNGETEQRPWKLGDFFHSNAVIVGLPSPFFVDDGFSGFRALDKVKT